MIPSGKLSHNYGKSPFLMGKSTISMSIFNSYFDITRGYVLHECRNGMINQWSSCINRVNGKVTTIPRVFPIKTTRKIGRCLECFHRFWRKSHIIFRYSGSFYPSMFSHTWGGAFPVISGYLCIWVCKYVHDFTCMYICT